MLGALLGAGASLLGSLFGKSSADKANAMQMDAAKHGVEWRVADAKAAGIHPLAALGMNPISLSPIAVGGEGIADAGSQLGQSLDKAIAMNSTAGQRSSFVQSKLMDLQLEGAQLDNDIKRAKLASDVRTAFGAGTGPIVPAVGPNTARGGDIGGQTLPLPFGLTWKTSRTPTSEEWERQYGDTSQEVYGISRLIGDAGLNARRALDYLHVPSDADIGNALSELFGIFKAY